jgi:hypothetical protein
VQSNGALQFGVNVSLLLGVCCMSLLAKWAWSFSYLESFFSSFSRVFSLKSCTDMIDLALAWWRYRKSLCLPLSWCCKCHLFHSFHCLGLQNWPILIIKRVVWSLYVMTIHFFFYFAVTFYFLEKSTFFALRWPQTACVI